MKHPPIKPHSWLNLDLSSDFSIYNLPFGIFSTSNSPKPRVGIALGNQAICLQTLLELKLLDAPSQGAWFGKSLNAFLESSPEFLKKTRLRVQQLYSDSSFLSLQSQLESALAPMDKISLHMPIEVRNYVDFYSSLEHATNVGKMFRDASNPLLPNWKHIPIGYHGRSSTVVLSGTPVVRPHGQIKLKEEDPPQFAPTKQLDFELEMGLVMGKEIPMGQPISAATAYDALFGFVLLNDWSARDIQKWEYVPLGPFLGKSFATSISGWVVTKEALEPFLVEGPLQDVPVLPYLEPLSQNRVYDVQLEVYLKSQSASNPQRICQTNYKHMYWDPVQQVVHMASNGSGICVGDLYGSGTISGTTEGSFGSLLELTWKGTKPLTLNDGSTRTFIADLDCVTLTGFAQSAECRVGFGSVANQVLPPRWI